MIKGLIAIFFVLLGVYVFMWVAGFYNRATRPGAGGEAVSVVQTAPHASSTGPSPGGTELPGLPSNLEASLAAAHQGGAEELGKWLKQWSRHVQDPRLAWIELDYVVLLNLKSHKAARERFLQVQSRIAPGSPVYDRITKLAPAYEQ